MADNCARCGRDCSDGDCWHEGELDSPVAYCIVCITPEERSNVVDGYRKTTRESSALAADLSRGSLSDSVRAQVEELERDANRLREEADRIAGT